MVVSSPPSSGSDRSCRSIAQELVAITANAYADPFARSSAVSIAQTSAGTKATAQKQATATIAGRSESRQPQAQPPMMNSGGKT